MSETFAFIGIIFIIPFGMLHELIQSVSFLDRVADKISSQRREAVVVPLHGLRPLARRG